MYILSRMTKQVSIRQKKVNLLRNFSNMSIFDNLLKQLNYTGVSSANREEIMGTLPILMSY